MKKTKNIWVDLCILANILIHWRCKQLYHLKVSKSRKQIMASWILPKNERWGIFLNIKMPQCSFFGRIKDNIFFFRNLLTFSWKSCKSSQKAAFKSVPKYDTFLMVQTVLIIWINHIHDSYSKIISWIFSGNKSNQDFQLSMKKMVIGNKSKQKPLG